MSINARLPLLPVARRARAAGHADRPAAAAGQGAVGHSRLPAAAARGPAHAADREGARSGVPVLLAARPRRVALNPRQAWAMMHATHDHCFSPLGSGISAAVLFVGLARLDLRWSACDWSSPDTVRLADCDVELSSLSVCAAEGRPRGRPELGGREPSQGLLGACTGGWRARQAAAHAAPRQRARLQHPACG